MKRFSTALSVTRSYYLLTKPGIILGNLVTTAAGFSLGFQGGTWLALFFLTLIGLGCVIASACTFNNTIDRAADAKMARTSARPLVTGKISLAGALFFASVLGLFGALLLGLFVNVIAMLLGLLGLFIYVCVYSLLKYKSTLGTVIGSISGAMPPVVGYTAASNSLDLGAFLLFGFLVFWQMPHFFAIAIYRMRDYQAAALPVLPVKRGVFVTKIQMLLYLAAFISISPLFVLFGYLTAVYLFIALVLDLPWFILAIWGFFVKNDPLFARRMFILSLVALIGQCLAIPFTKA